MSGPPTQSVPYNGASDAEALYKAMKGIGTNDKVLSDIIATRTRDQLVQVGTAFQSKYGKTLASWIKGDTSGNYQDLLLSLIDSKADYDAKLLHDAVAGLGTDDTELIEVLCTRNNQDIKEMKVSYQKLFGKSAEQAISGDTSFNYKETLLAICRCEREESMTVNIEQVKKDAQALYQAGEGRMGTNEKVFIDILTHRTYPHLQLLNQQYAILTGHSLESGISKETSGDFKQALTVILTPRDEYFAEQIRDAIAGAGTKDKKLVRCLAHISTNKELLKATNNYYTHRYKHNLANDVGGDTSGWYGKTCSALIQTRVAL